MIPWFISPHSITIVKKAVLNNELIRDSDTKHCSDFEAMSTDHQVMLHCRAAGSSQCGQPFRSCSSRRPTR